MNVVNEYANTSKVEEYLYGIINGVVSDHVFVGELPTTIDNTWRDMVLIDCNLPMSDLECYSRATVYLFLYARPNADGTKNVPKMAELERKVNDVLSSASSEHYSINRSGNGADYDTDIKWHRNFVHLNLIVTC